MKTCPHCKRSLLPTAFNRDRTKADGLACWCRECRESRKKLWRKARRDLVAKHNATYRQRRKPEGARAAVVVGTVVSALPEERTVMNTPASAPASAPTSVPTPAPMDDRTIIEILKALAQGSATQAAIAERFGVVVGTVNSIKCGQHRRAAELAQQFEVVIKPPPLDWLTLQTPKLNAYRKST
jgi:hypothetical protein